MARAKTLLFTAATALLIAGCGDGSLASTARAAHRIPAPGVSSKYRFDDHLLVDQFGYRPADPKVAVIRDPVIGFDNGHRFTPGTLYQVRNALDGRVVFSGAPTPWNAGATEPSSGDRGWWFDFSAYETPGTYFVFDTQKGVRSATFRIDPNVYRAVLKAAVRMYFYQRSGFAKRPPYADPCWSDDPAYLGPDQDSAAHDVTDRDNAAKVRDLSGGWFDAGDTDKYVTFAGPAVHQLLTAFQEHPSAFGDDFGIPESGNGIPDLLDEVNWEIKWLEKMQYPDGSAALKVGDIAYTGAAPPSSDHSPRYYVPSCTSATIAVAGMFAHAAFVLGRFPALRNEAADLTRRAQRAWNNYQGAHVKQTHCDDGTVKAGNADWSEKDQDAAAVVAAVYLYAVTGDAAYDHYVGANYKILRPYHDIGWARYDADQGEALLFYTTLPNASAGLRKAILNDKLSDVRAGNQVYGFASHDDLYRAFLPDPQYHWGSNNPRAQYGNTNMDVLTYGIDPPGDAKYADRALGILHYFHGVNPFAMVYMTNMYALGATRSVNEIYHSWFWHGTRWSDALTSACGPAPGFVPGGPDAGAVRDGVPATVAPPAGQPPQKSYRDWNGAWPESSWVVNEPAIYYQAAYVDLLSKFVN